MCKWKMMQTYFRNSSRRDPNIIKINVIKSFGFLSRYIFRTVNAINVLFSTLHTTPFLYDKIILGILHLLRASIATSDTLQGMNPS